ncbi:MAG: TolC family protein [Acidobacteriota bacterium]
MKFHLSFRAAMILLIAFITIPAFAQDNEGIVSRNASSPRSTTHPADAPLPSVVSRYKADDGATGEVLIRRALASNIDLAAARLDIQRARARLSQARLIPNPTIEFEQTTGNLTGSQGERETSIGFSLPLEISGQRRSRIDLARVELEAAEAEIADRERRLVAEVRAAFAETLALIRELEITEGINSLDTQTARLVEARVTEGESAPIELNLLRVEVDRLKSRRALIEGRLQSAMLRLKTLTGIPANEPLRVREDLAAPPSVNPPASLEAAIDIALRSRPDLRLARLAEKAAEAGLQLARAQSRPDVTAFTKYSSVRSTFDDTPVGVLRDKDKLLTFGVSISLPFFNRNQGAKAEATTAIIQAQRRREFVEQLIRAEVAGAYTRYEAAQSAIAVFEQGVLARSSQNVQSIRAAYQLGAFRLTELLVEQRRSLDSEREFIEALAERHRSLADLLSAIAAPIDK